MSEDKIVLLRPNPEGGPGGGGGGGVDARLRAVEDRLARLETRMEYMATKEDIQKLKIWFLWGALGIGLLLVKAFFL